MLMDLVAPGKPLSPGAMRVAAMSRGSWPPALRRQGRLLLLAAALAAVAHAQSLAGGVNSLLPGWLRFGGEYRARQEAAYGIGYRDADDVYLLPRLRLGLTVAPSSWSKFVFQAQDARIAGNDRIPSSPPYRNTMDLRMAYAEFGDPDKQPFGLRVGRQELLFGEQRLLGNSNWSNISRTFDAVRATVNVAGWRFDAFASSVVPARDGIFDRPRTGNNLHGFYASGGKLVPGSVAQAYVLWRLGAGSDFRTWGTRWTGSLPAGFDYGIEMALQSGRFTAQRPLRAWGGHWQAGRALPSVVHPHLVAEYNYATGDRGGGVRRTFDSLYPTPHAKYGLTDQVGWRNMHGIRFGVEMKPHRAWAVNANWRQWWRASARDGLYNAGGTLVVPAGDIAALSIGQELEGDAAWSPNANVQVGAGVGHLFPGAFLRQATPGRTYTLQYLFLNYTF